MSTSDDEEYFDNNVGLSACVSQLDSVANRPQADNHASSVLMEIARRIELREAAQDSVSGETSGNTSNGVQTLLNRADRVKAFVSDYNVSLAARRFELALVEDINLFRVKCQVRYCHSNVGIF